MNARRFPRTLNEAFGPYTSTHITEDKAFSDWDGVAIIVGCIVAVIVVYAWVVL